MKKTLVKGLLAVIAVLMIAGCAKENSSPRVENEVTKQNVEDTHSNQEVINLRDNLISVNTWKGSKVVLANGEEINPNEYFKMENIEGEIGLHFTQFDTFSNDYLKSISEEASNGRFEIIEDGNRVRLIAKDSTISFLTINDETLIQTLENGDQIYYEKLVPAEAQLVQKYQLSSGYELTDAFKEVNYSLISKNQLMKENQVFESDNTQFEMTGNVENDSSSITVLLNGKPLNTSVGSKDKLKEDGIVDGSFVESVGILDLDENDIYKEIIVCRENDEFKTHYIFRVEKDHLVLLLKEKTKSDSLYQIGNQWIYTNMLNSWIPITMGYDIYENGSFHHVDRFLTGEKLIQEDGTFAEKFQEKVFEISENTGIVSKVDNMNTQLLTGTKFNILASKQATSEFGGTVTAYQIKVVEDSSWEKLGAESEEDALEKIEAGTILDKVIIWE